MKVVFLPQWLSGDDKGGVHQDRTQADIDSAQAATGAAFSGVAAVAGLSP